MTDQYQPGWGQPGYTVTPEPGPPGKPPIYKRGWFIALVVIIVGGLLFTGCLGVLGTALTEAGDDLGSPTAKTSTPATVPEDEDAGATETTEPPSNDAPPVAKVGETLTMTDGFGEELAEVTVGGRTSPSGNHGVRFSTGDEYNKPEHGVWMGVWVKVVAKKDGVDSVYGDLHVSQGGQHYEGDACCPDGFKPTLDYVTLSEGETTQGWVVFDVRSRHGEIVIADYDGERIGAWKF